ncbi:MAG: nucleotidyltransferase domain-containing protein [Candidatus Bathyarchaeia archaeon]|nr:nucleotidyltransferase domain-containing protein [Candidatus Bathyarchaeota archaeon]
MLKLRRVDIERGGEVFEKIEAYVKRVVESLNPHMVILFGSFATGDINEGSDIDILVVADFKENFLDRIKTLMELNTFGIPIEPIGYTPREFEEMRMGGNRFIMEVTEKGKILYQAKDAK